MPAGLKQRVAGAAKIALPIVASIVVLFVVSHFVDWQATFAHALRAPVWAIAVGSCLVWLQLVLCGLRMTLMANFAGASLGRTYSTSIWALGFLSGLVLPTSVGAEVVKGLLLTGKTRLPARVVGILALDQAMALSAMLLLILVTLPFSVGLFAPEYAVAFAVLTPAIVILLALALLNRGQLARVLLRIFKAVRF
ncbi:hypothetical protein EON80_32220, partial [bacterium]